MSFKILLDLEAFKDLEEAVGYYETQQENLGAQFKETIDRHFTTLQTNPFFQIRYNDVRCLPVKKFPYMIHFQLHEEKKEVIIRAVLNTHLDPEKWKR